MECYKNSGRKTHKKTICLDKNNSISSFNRISFRIELDDGRMGIDDGLLNGLLSRHNETE